MSQFTLKGHHVLIMFVGGFSIIIAVNMTLAFNAVSTFPGLETKNSYVASQSFDADRAAQEAVDLPEPSTGHTAEGPREVPQVVLEGLSDEALLAISREKTLALDLVEMQTVRDHYAGLGRAPTALELETIAQTWSEHCKHKTLTGPIAFVEKDAQGAVVREVQWTNLLKQTVFAATAELDLPRCLSVFVDNAGVIKFNDELGVAVKVETHNHPSAIEPYGGAGTGIGGVVDGAELPDLRHHYHQPVAVVADQHLGVNPVDGERAVGGVDAHFRHPSRTGSGSWRHQRVCR